MPQVSDRFGPIYANVTLDGSGNGQVSFQAQGSNIRVTNLFVRVATSTNQAVCKMYKNQVADGNLISITNSGSTGAAAHGAIDLFDGETVIARWTGGDAAAIATATFVGIKLPFSDRPTSTELTWDDPIAAGDGSLIYPALKSPNYVTGVSGWKIDRTGSVEFNNAVIRGTLIAGGGTVVLSNSGLHVDGSNQQYDINTTAGILARALPDNGADVQIEVLTGYLGNSVGGFIALEAETPSANGNTMDFGSLNVEYGVSGGTDRPLMTLHGLHVHGKQEPVIDMWGQRSTAGTDDSQIDLQAASITLNAGSFILGTTKFSRPNVLVYFSQSIPNSAVTQLVNASFTIARDNYNMYNNGLFVIPRDGTYEIGITGRYASQAVVAGQRQVRMQVNGVDYYYEALSPTTALNNTLIPITMIQRDVFATGDLIGFQGFQNSGVAAVLGNTARAWAELIED